MNEGVCNHGVGRCVREGLRSSAHARVCLLSSGARLIVRKIPSLKARILSSFRPAIDLNMEVALESIDVGREEPEVSRSCKFSTDQFGRVPRVFSDESQVDSPRLVTIRISSLSSILLLR